MRRGLLALLMCACGDNARPIFDGNREFLIRPATLEPGDGLGIAALSGDGRTLALGAPFDDAGAVYVYVRDQSGWRQQAYLRNTGEHFGVSVSLSRDGNTLAVGANTANAVRGRVYLYDRAGTTWTERTTLDAPNADEGDVFGSHVALSADAKTLVVSAPRERRTVLGAGAIYVFAHDEGTWSQQARLEAAQPAESDNFGEYIGLSSDGNTLAVGVPRDDGAATDSGAVFVFTRVGSTWGQHAYLKGTEPGDNFGDTLAIAGDGQTLVIAAPSRTESTGVVFVFSRGASSWTQDVVLQADHPELGDHFGSALAMSLDGKTFATASFTEDSAATGVNGDALDNSAQDSGAAYVFTLDGTWKQRAYVKASNTMSLAQFGFRIALDDSGAVLAATAIEHEGGGAAYVLE